MDAVDAIAVGTLNTDVDGVGGAVYSAVAIVIGIVCGCQGCSRDDTTVSIALGSC